MLVSLIILAALVAVGLPLYLMYRRDLRREGADITQVSQPATPIECCGQHEVCERDLLIADASRPIEYFDDEELDRFSGRGAEAYDDDEVNEFREVLLTLRPDEVAPWGRSIQLRGITLPQAVRDEFLLLAAEQRQSTQPQQ
ncbi:MAG: phospholipase [Muribaculaceae bacterium]|nr:phospholipase [Muribaculaceae bacterium]